MNSYHSIIVGGGAAGLYAALHASRRGRRVLVLERNSEVGAKILISGGGRCNFTNLNANDPARYLSANPHFARSALARHTQHDFIALVNKHGIAHYEKTLGQLFCEGARSSAKIVRMLLDECATGGVGIRVGSQIAAIRRNERFAVETSQGVFESETLTIATGGLSIPKLGATFFAFDVAKQFSVPIVTTRPGLVPLVFAEADLAWMRPLSGVSANVVVRAGSAAFREAALFTHRGLSGPAILQVSSYWRDGEDIVIDWLPDASDDVLAARKRERPKAQLKSVLAELLSERLAAALCQQLVAASPAPGGGGRGRGRAEGTATAPLAVPPARPPSLPSPRWGEGSVLGDLKDAALADAARALKAWPLTPIGTEGYSKAEVTVGGVDTDALSQQTMECRAVPGLFFIGECVDVTGWLGGYNFQWAWSSGWAAGQAI